MPTSDKLESDPVNLHELFSADNELWCPLFQRPFVWDKSNFDQLWADIDTIIDGEFDLRFLGALVFDNDYPSSAKRAGLYWIIDGQQRLTTFYLILLALVEVAREISLSETADELIEQYLLSRKSNSKGKPKLRPTLQDTRQFNKILSVALGEHVVLNYSNEEGPVDGALRKGYELILSNVRERCLNEDKQVDIEKVERFRTVLLDKIEFVEIRLGTNHDPNEVFDRLNKEGERLGIIDLVRNEVLKRLRETPNIATDLYAKHWKPFEEAFPDPRHRDRYFFPFALSFDPSVTKPKTFPSLTTRWNKLVEGTNKPNEQIELIMRDLSTHLFSYLALSYGLFDDSLGTNVNQNLKRLYEINSPSAIYPYIFNLLYSFRNKETDEENVVQVLKIIESFLVRRAVLGIEPTGLHAVFKSLWKKADSDIDKVRENIVTATIAFPSDEEFIEAIKYSPIYRRRICEYLIIERERTFTKGDILETFPKITIDHLLPQTPDGEWLEIFSEQELEKWTDTFANLVPLSQKANSEKSRSSWSETKDLLGNETVFSTTKTILDKNDKWTTEELEKRAGILAIWAIERWPK